MYFLWPVYVQEYVWFFLFPSQVERFSELTAKRSRGDAFIKHSPHRPQPRTRPSKGREKKAKKVFDGGEPAKPVKPSCLKHYSARHKSHAVAQVMSGIFVRYNILCDHCHMSLCLMIALILYHEYLFWIKSCLNHCQAWWLSSALAFSLVCESLQNPIMVCYKEI